MGRAFWICGLTVLALPAAAQEPLTLTVTPTISFAPATISIRARIAPNVNNRLLSIVADGSQFYRSSDIQLDGDQAPKTIQLFFSQLPGGEYNVYAVLADASGHRRAMAHQSTRVMSQSEGSH